MENNNSINSSKVYCKFLKVKPICRTCGVLIVAKCIVNSANISLSARVYFVLIVAKCIVNPYVGTSQVYNAPY